MGDRSNIAIQYNSGETIHLYGHWMGDENIKVVTEALTEGRRTEDESYFARILFSKMVASDIDGETGFGIAPYRIMDENNLITVCPSEGWVQIENQHRLTYAEFLSKYQLV